jgi:hypothetical protein
LPHSPGHGCSWRLFNPTTQDSRTQTPLLSTAHTNEVLAIKDISLNVFGSCPWKTHRKTILGKIKIQLFGKHAQEKIIFFQKRESEGC